MNKNKRFEWIDAVKGIGILLMVLGHMHVGDAVRGFIYSFHMPMFILISGYLYHHYESLKVVTGRKTKALLIPYICYNVFAVFLRWGLLFLTGYFTWDGAWGIARMQAKTLLGGNSFYRKILISIETSGPMWFVPFLFCINIFYYLYAKLEKQKKINKWIGLLFFLLLSFIGKEIGEKVAFLPWSLDCAMIGLFFFFIGVWMKERDMLNKKVSVWIWPFLLVFWLALYGRFGEIAFATREYTVYPICLFIAVAASILLMKGMKEADGRFRFKLPIHCLAWVGRNAIWILAIHSLDFIYVEGIEKIQNRIPERFLSFVVYFAYLLIWVAFIKVMQWILQKCKEFIFSVDKQKGT